MEIRWFKKGPLPLEIKDWFFEAGKEWVQNESRREDFYHHFTQKGQLGTKLREGSIQIKELNNVIDHRFGTANVEGQIEYWLKWSFDVADGEEELGALKHMTEKWLKVEKKRWQRYFQRQGDDIVSVAPHIDPDKGCEFEITEITFQRQKWWTLSFESMGRENQLKKNLIKTMQYVFEASAIPLTLASENSYSYPSWLQSRI